MHIVGYHEQEGWLAQEVVTVRHSTLPRGSHDPMGAGTLPGTLDRSAHCSSFKELPGSAASVIP